MNDTADKPHWFRTVLLRSSAVAAFGLLVSTAATQFVADRLNYHRGLGEPIIGHFYAPWRWYEWQTAPWAKNAPYTFAITDAGLFAACGLSAWAVFASRARKRRRPTKHDGVHGTSALLTKEADIRRTGLLARKHGDHHEGVYVGGWSDKSGGIHYLRHNGPEHCIVIAPTRSGKGVCNIIPTLLSWLDSCVVYDEKGELWALTAGWREKHANNSVIRLELSGADNVSGFNFLSEVRLRTDHEVADAQNIALMLCDPEGVGLADHWQKTSHKLIAGTILHVLYENSNASLSDVIGAFSNPNRPVSKLYVEMIENTHLDGGKNHPFIASAGRDQFDRDERERSSVLSSAKSNLALFEDPIIQRNTRTSSFRMMDIMNRDKPMSIYVVARGGDKERLRPLIRLLLTMMTRTLTDVSIQFKDGRPIPPHRHRLLMMLDEFPSLKKLPAIADALPIAAGYGIKFFLVAQNREQLFAAYGQQQTITANCHIRILFAPNEWETARWASDMIGTTTIVKEDVTESGSRWGSMNHVSRTFHEVSRPLMTPDEIARLRKPRKELDKNGKEQIVEAGDMIVLIAGESPIKGTQILYFIDPVFSQRATIQPPTSGAIIQPEQTTAPVSNRPLLVVAQ